MNSIYLEVILFNIFRYTIYIVNTIICIPLFSPYLFGEYAHGLPLQYYCKKDAYTISPFSPVVKG